MVFLVVESSGVFYCRRRIFAGFLTVSGMVLLRGGETDGC